MSKKVAIIGGGNLGTAIAEGLINSVFSLYASSDHCNQSEVPSGPGEKHQRIWN